MGTIKDIVKRCRHEGFVCYVNKQAVKIKSPYYLSLKAMARKSDILSLQKSRVDEEYYPLLAHLKEIDGFGVKPEQERLNYIRDYLNDN